MRWYEGFWAIYKGVELQEVCLETLNPKKKTNNHTKESPFFNEKSIETLN